MKKSNKLFKRIGIDDTEYLKLKKKEYYLILYFLVN